jgi:uncharacterized membrane protein YhaH (DUF805 family)
MTFIKSLFSFEGRYSRSRYWLIGVGLQFLIMFVLIIAIAVMAALLNPAGWKEDEYGALATLLFIPSIAIGIATSVKRLHDLGHTGWWSVLSLVPFANIALGIWLGFFRGTEGPNAFGPDPLQKSAAPAATAPSADTITVMPSVVVPSLVPARAPAAVTRWVLEGVQGQYQGCEFPFDDTLTFGTDARRCSVVIDAQRHPEVAALQCQLRPAAGTEGATLHRPAPDGTLARDSAFNGLDLDLGGGLRFRLRPASA